MKYGHKLQIKVEGYDDRGRGTCRIGIDGAGKQTPAGQGVHDMTLAIPFTCPGDEIDVTFVGREYGVKICRLNNLIEPGPDRVTAPCPHAGTCGGCLWQHIRYAAQLSEKESGVKALFASLGFDVRVKPIVPADHEFGYRNRMDFCVGWNGEVGLKEYGSWNKYVNIQECLLVNPRIGPILQTVRDWMIDCDLQPWDAKFHSGDVRYVVIRDGQNTKQRMVTIVVHDASRINARAKQYLIDRLGTTHPNSGRDSSFTAIPYTKKLYDTAGQLRKLQTPAGQKIWNEILCDHQTGYKFLRQKPLDGFIADFYCPELLLVVEIDGPSHITETKKDEERSDYLAGLGVKVIHFSDNQIMDDIKKVKTELMRQIQARQEELASVNLLPDNRDKRGGVPLCTSLLLGELTKDTDLSLAESFEALIGQPWFEEKVNGITYNIHPNSFFQTNSSMAEKLQSTVLDAISVSLGTRDEVQATILDLYCGLGFFGIAAAKRFPGAHIYGYEIDEQAIKLASQNAKINEVGERCEFYSGKAEDLTWKNLPADFVIIDPPRSGLHPKVIMNLVGENAMQPRSILYVSCNYHRLKDELPAFLKHYDIDFVQPLDLFPQTRHVEVVVSLKRKAA